MLFRIMLPRSMRIAELMIPNIFFNFFFSSNFPIPSIESMMYKKSTRVTAQTPANPSESDFCNARFTTKKKTGPIASWRNNHVMSQFLNIFIGNGV